MVLTPPAERTVLRSREAHVVVEYDDSENVRLSLVADGYDSGAADLAQLVCEAVYQARMRHTPRVGVALHIASPACSVVIEALRRRTGNDIERLVMRRAGSSVMVTLVLRPWPTVPRTPVASHGSLIPTQPEHRTRRSPVGEVLQPR